MSDNETLNERLEAAETENSALRQQVEHLTAEVERLKPFEETLRSETILAWERSSAGITPEKREQIVSVNDPNLLIAYKNVRFLLDNSLFDYEEDDSLLAGVIDYDRERQVFRIGTSLVAKNI